MKLFIEIEGNLYFGKEKVGVFDEKQLAEKLEFMENDLKELLIQQTDADEVEFIVKVKNV